MATTNKRPHLTLLGAGIGDPDLITVKGTKALAQADVVLYDALVSKELLDYAPAHAEKVFVGKRAGHHSVKQEDTNKLIVSFALSKGHVVRLKGGDPFIFGRGHEEMQYAESFGIPTTYIPGITSSVAAAGLQNIPLTRRGISESFWVVTGTTKSGELSSDLALAAQSTATVVILMGTKKLQEIMNVFSAFGKQDMPVAIIQNSSMPDEKVGVGTVSSIVEIAEKEQLGSPAVIVVGEVAALHKEFPLEISEKVKAYSS
ncbi:uroporphyrinogen-III C-methyltransferase [Limibacter armeniacum]|uniref:uroporphyrinogen-III C-methyltransferase n=1 Tax=Limibacter armeniacum TaxID=466084 RepID=UPI002FE5B489